MSDNTFLVNRRTLLAGMAGIALSSRTMADEPAASAGESQRPFPKGFRWGVATAAHQIEGNNVNSDFWYLENATPTTFTERSGDACDSYHRYEEDIALLAELGFNTYRFSIEWARIEPTRGQFSIAELDYYKRVIECCHKHGVAPAVTFLHNTAPLWFAMAGGWLNSESPALFARYCSTVAKALGDGMAYAFTINEPQVAKVFRVIPGAQVYFDKHDKAAKDMHIAAAKALNVERFVTMEYPDIDGMTPQLIAGHEQGYAAIKAACKDLPVGVTLSITDFQPGSEESSYEDLRRAAYGAWLDTISRTGDFTGVQPYNQMRVPGKGKKVPAPAPLPWKKAGDPLSDMTRPEALSNAVQYVYAQTKKPILVTENGLETENDEYRIWYIDQALKGLQQQASQIPLIGYIHWTLLDNFEWTRGYKPKFGLVAVDRTSFERTPKPSAHHLGDIARRNAV